MRRGQSRTAAESVCGLGVNQSLSQPINCIALTAHEDLELTKRQAALYVGLGRYGRWNSHPKSSYDAKLVSFVVVESLFDATVTLFEPLDWKITCLMHALTNQLR